MVVPKRPTVRRRYSQYDVRKAMQAVKNKGLSITAASRKFGIPKSTLQDKLSGRTKLKVPLGRPSVLSPKEEQTLVDWINNVSNAGFCVKKEQILTSVARLVKELNRPNPFSGSKPGERWYRRFLNRHKEVARTLSETLAKSKAYVSENNLRRWHSKVRCYVEKNHLGDIFQDPCRIFSADESAFFLCSKVKHVLVRKGLMGLKTSANATGNSKVEYLTVLVTGNAAGDLAPTVVMYPYKQVPQKVSNLIPDSWCFGNSECGWMTEETFSKYVVNVFYPWLLESGTPLPVALFINGQAPYINKHLSEFCSNHKIELIALYPNLINVIQPMEVAVFHPLNTGWREGVEKLQLENEGRKIQIEQFAPLLKEVIDNSVKKETIINGFKATGLLDLDSNQVKFHELLRKRPQQHELSRKLIEVQGHLSYLEEKIGMEKLQSFVREEIKLRDEELFNVLHAIIEEISGLKEQMAAFYRPQEVLSAIAQEHNEIESSQGNHDDNEEHTNIFEYYTIGDGGINNDIEKDNYSEEDNNGMEDSEHDNCSYHFIEKVIAKV